MGKIIKLKDKEGDGLYPATVFDAISDGKGTSLSRALERLEEKGSLDVVEDGFYVCDVNGNVGMSYTAIGLDSAAFAENLLDLVSGYIREKEGDRTDLSRQVIAPLDTWMFSKSLAGGFVEVTLPHSCNAVDGVSASYYRGNTYYKRSIEVSGVGVRRFYLLFKSASQQSTVAVNGMPMGYHKGGYTPFVIDITDALQDGSNEIMVGCDNKMDLTLAPVSSDFNKNNGLVDNVYLVTTSLVHSDISAYGVDRMHVTQGRVSTESAALSVRARLRNDSSADMMIRAYVYMRHADSSVAYSYQEDIFCAGHGTTDLAHDLTLENPHLWDGKIDPYLYTAEVIFCAGAVVLDRMAVKVGLRFYGITASGFTLNGRPYPLRGISYHQDKALRASAVTREDIDADFEIIKDLGCNFLRIAHYPHNTYTFDKCDELGIVTQTEIPWVNECGVNASTAYLDNLESQMREMIVNHYNHASIIFWGMSNELGNTHAGNPQGAIDKAKVVEYSNILYALGKSLDTTRYVGFVTDKSGGATSYYGGRIDCDWLGRNSYCGWYTYQDNPAAISGLMDGERKSFPYVALSEYGAGCNPDCHSETPASTTNKGSGGARHDEEWANYVHEIYLQKIYGNMTYLQFTSVWILFDFAVAARKEGYLDCVDGVTTASDPAMYYLNDKGIVTRDRALKKDAFYLYRAKWNPTPQVYIASRRFSTRPSPTVTVKVYSNAASVDLYQNGILRQTMDGSGEASGVIWTFDELSFVNATDTFKAVGRNVEGVEIAVDEVTFNTSAL